MALKKYEDGEVLYAADLNSSQAEPLTEAGLNLIRQLIDRDIDFSANEIDWWGDAYIDSNGRENSVVLADTNSLFDTNKYVGNIENDFGTKDDTSGSTTTLKSGVKATVQETMSVISLSKFSGSSTTKAYIYDSTVTSQLGVATFSGDKATFASPIVLTSGTYYFLADKNGSAYHNNSDISTSYPSADFGPYLLSTGYLRGADDSDGVYEIEKAEWVPSGSYFPIIEHTIPSGTFNSTISEAIGVPFVEDWEVGADVQYKLTNAGGDDSGYLNSATPEVSTFTAFTAEPDTLTVKLVPKTSSPTSGYPSIRGFVVRAT